MGNHSIRFSIIWVFSIKCCKYRNRCNYKTEPDDEIIRTLYLLPQVNNSIKGAQVASAQRVDLTQCHKYKVPLLLTILTEVKSINIARYRNSNFCKLKEPFIS